MATRFTLALASMVLLGGLTACGDVSRATDTPSLDGTAWVLSALPGRTLVAGATATVRFEAGQAGGSDGCNQYSVPYTASGGTLKFTGPAAATQMACEPEVMEQGGAFLAALTGARGYRVEQGQLALLGADGAVVARLAPQSQELAGTSWRVTGYNNGKQAVVGVLGGTTLTLAFGADGRVSGSAGCNDYSGAYRSSGAALSFGPLATTRMMCATPEGVMEQERQFLRALETVATARRDGERLELRTAAGALAVSLTPEGTDPSGRGLSPSSRG